MTEDNVIRIGPKHLVFIAIILVAVVFLFGKGLKNNNNITGEAVNTVAIENGEVQHVTLSMGGEGYILNPAVLKKDIPVRMEVDLNSVYGCMRDVVIPSFGVRKYVKENDNIIEFIPTKKGSIPIMCSMNMGKGMFTVV